MADQGSEGLLSPFLRARRIRAVKRHIRGRILDAGCGAGFLADFIDPENYVGVDPDPESLEEARRNHPYHSFHDSLPSPDRRFDSIVALAVIEHFPDPRQFLMELAARLDPGKGSRIILTTPHPRFEKAYKIGAALGVFSRHADEEHQQLLDLPSMKLLAVQSGLRISLYRRFLLGANQLFILEALLTLELQKGPPY